MNTCTGVGKSRFIVASTQNTEFVLVPLFIKYYIIFTERYIRLFLSLGLLLTSISHIYYTNTSFNKIIYWVFYSFLISSLPVSKYLQRGITNNFTMFLVNNM